MKHILLTGDIQVGKSTALRRALENRDLIIGGYRTVGGMRAPDGNSYVHLLRADTYEQLGPHNRILHRKPVDGKIVFEVNEDVFERKGTTLLRQLPKDCQLILIDEIGMREQNCKELRRAILDTLDGDIPVLGVVQIRPNAFLDKIRRHPNVNLIKVTKENRDEIPRLLNEYLSRL